LNASERHADSFIGNESLTFKGVVIGQGSAIQPSRGASQWLLGRPAVLRRKLQRLCLRLMARQSPATLAGVVPTAQPSPSARFRRGLFPLDSGQSFAKHI